MVLWMKVAPAFYGKTRQGGSAGYIICVLGHLHSYSQYIGTRESDNSKNKVPGSVLMKWYSILGVLLTHMLLAANFTIQNDAKNLKND